MPNVVFRSLKRGQRMGKPCGPTTVLLFQVSYDFHAHSKNSVCDVKVKSLYMYFLSVLI